MLNYLHPEKTRFLYIGWFLSFFLSFLLHQSFLHQSFLHQSQIYIRPIDVVYNPPISSLQNGDLDLIHQKRRCCLWQHQILSIQFSISTLCGIISLLQLIPHPLGFEVIVRGRILSINQIYLLGIMFKMVVNNIKTLALKTVIIKLSEEFCFLLFEIIVNLIKTLALKTLILQLNMKCSFRLKWLSTLLIHWLINNLILS